MMNKITDDVKAFTQAVGCTTDVFNVEQTGLYMGLICEELGEVFYEIKSDLFALIVLQSLSKSFKAKDSNHLISKADRVKLAHELCDLIWVTTGALLSMGVDIDGAMGELARANMSKLHECELCKSEGFYVQENIITDGTCPACNGTGYICQKDANGKVIKPDTFVQADMSRVLCKS